MFSHTSRRIHRLGILSRNVSVITKRRRIFSKRCFLMNKKTTTR
jgi:hypothetical protein